MGCSRGGGDKFFVPRGSRLSTQQTEPTGLHFSENKRGSKGGSRGKLPAHHASCNVRRDVLFDKEGFWSPNPRATRTDVPLFVAADEGIKQEMAQVRMETYNMLPGKYLTALLPLDIHTVSRLCLRDSLDNNTYLGTRGVYIRGFEKNA